MLSYLFIYFKDAFHSIYYIKLFLGVQVENDNILIFEEESSSFPISKVLLHQNAVVTVCSNTVKYEAVCIRIS